jgi:methyltransferase
MFQELIGPSQIAALVVLFQRALEELYSAHNTRRLIGNGAYEVGRDYYPVVAVTHLAWIAGLFFIIPPAAPASLPIIGVYLVLQIIRYWIIGTLGRYWTHRIITLDGAPLVRSGPYRYMRHPNYAVTIAETLVLPMAFGAVALAFIMTAVWTAVLFYKIALEDRALARRTGSGDLRC